MNFFHLGFNRTEGFLPMTTVRNMKKSITFSGSYWLAFKYFVTLLGRFGFLLPLLLQDQPITDSVGYLRRSSSNVKSEPLYQTAYNDAGLISSKIITNPVFLNTSSVDATDHIYKSESLWKIIKQDLIHFLTFTYTRAVDKYNTSLERKIQFNNVHNIYRSLQSRFKTYSQESKCNLVCAHQLNCFLSARLNNADRIYIYSYNWNKFSKLNLNK